MYRRGFASHLYSDNTTHFVGTDRLLQSFFKEAKTQQNLRLQLVNVGVQWRFIRPAAPHFGGIWEAAVKSAKKRMLKINNGSLYTHEELLTLLCRKEAVFKTSVSDLSLPFQMTPGIMKL